MKKVLLIIFIIFSFSGIGQINPTLGVGLEELTLKKGSIDVAALTEIIIEKQKELKKEALKRFMFKMFPQSNFATKFYVQNCLHILLNEKNPQVIEKEILELTTNYALALGIGKVYLEIDKIPLAKDQTKILIRSIDSLIKSNYKSKKAKNNPTGTINSLDYGLIVDIVSLGLSDSEKLRDKGFYKNRVDYTQDEEYKILSAKVSNDHDKLETDTAFVKLHDSLRKTIKRQVEAYTDHYEIIKEFFVNNKGTDMDVIAANLKGIYIKELKGLETQDFSMIFKDINPNYSAAVTATITKLKDSLNTRSPEKDYLSYSRQISALREVVEERRIAHNTLKQIVANASADFKKISEREYANPKNLLSTKPGIDTIQKATWEKYQPAYDDFKLKHDKFTNQVAIHRDVLDYFKDLNPNLANKKDIDIIMEFQQYESSNKKYLANKIQRQQELDDANLSTLVSDKDFFRQFIKSIMKDMLTTNAFEINLKNEEDKQLTVVSEYAETLSGYFNFLKLLSEKEKITLTDIKNIENGMIPTLYKFSIYDATSQSKIKATIDRFSTLVLLLKINVIQNVSDDTNLFYNENLTNILTFVANIDKLDRAETYQSIINIIRDNSEKIANCIDNDFKDHYRFFINAIKKYSLVNTEKQYVEIDVISFLNDLQLYYGRNEKSWFGLYFTLGLSENFLAHEVQLPGSEDMISSVGFASEKLGVKFRLRKFDDFVGFGNVVKNDLNLNKKNPFVNEIYAIAYGSGLLYSLADTTTKKNFDYPHVGFGAGLRFFNSLDFNISMGIPFIDGKPFSLHDRFLSIGLDIPLSEYLEKIAKK